MTTPSRLEPPPVRPRSSVFGRHPLVTYFTLAYATSWAIEIPLAAAAQGWTRRSVPFALHYLTAYGPLLAAIATTWLADGPDGLRRLGRRLGQWRIRPVWWLVAAAPLLLYGVAGGGLWLMRGAGTWSDVSLLGRVNYLPGLGVGALVLWFLTFGIGEEAGWRGFALPRLQRGRSALAASLMLGLFWFGWHLPTLLYLGTYVQQGPVALPGLLLGITAGSILLTWLYNGTKGSVLIAALWHATFNYVTASPVGDRTIAAIVSTAVMIWSVIVIFVWKPATLSPSGKEIV